ncbi:peroxisomal trans-2-enoyl-CoA reductase-like [Xyrauchen texanus]|uniref:peroxisomal trans-2-enoyl-CoA reductase-like n=1 Tax=Xyrauchen texanus TaxID=154827 RepID=UPI002241960E|nr:peroxisomal trans-2-enoyl-CoA reductase-like [Xyrauchen texanus]
MQSRYSVVISSRKLKRLVSAAEELTHEIPSSTSAKVTPIQCNIQCEDEVKSLMASTLKLHLRIELLVNNGGGQFSSPLNLMSAKGRKAVIDNLFMSLNLYLGHSYNLGASRAALDNLTKSLAIECASSGMAVPSSPAKRRSICSIGDGSYNQFKECLVRVDPVLYPDLEECNAEGLRPMFAVAH